MLLLLAAAATLFTNAEVITMDPARPRARAVLVEGERITAVGDDAELRKRAPRGVRVVDLQNQAVVPGFNDAHIHLGLGLSLADAVEVSSGRAEFLAEIKRRAEKLKKGEWLFALAKNGLPAGVETGAPIDAITDRPVLIASPRGGLMNGAAVNTSGLNNQLPWGFIRGRYLAPALDAIAHRRPTSELESVAREFLADARLYGITSVQAIDDFAELFDRLRQAGLLTTRIRFVPLAVTFGDNYRVSSFAASAPDWVRTDGWKYFHDEDGPLERRVLKEMVARSIAARRRVVVHVLGRSALGSLLDEIERQTTGRRELSQLFRVDHADVVPREEARRLARLGMSVCSNPTLASESGRERAFPARSLLDEGVALCFGSDWLGRRSHARRLDPMAGVRFAATRPGPERITAAEALRAYTLGAARAEGQDGQKGSLARGKLADFIVLSTDPTAVPPARLDWVRVRMTVVGGRIVHSDMSEIRR